MRFFLGKEWLSSLCLAFIFLDLHVPIRLDHRTRAKTSGAPRGKQHTHTLLSQTPQSKTPQGEKEGVGERDRIGGYDAPLAVVVAVATLPVGLYQAHKVLGKGVSMTEKGIRPPKKDRKVRFCPVALDLFGEMQ